MQSLSVLCGSGRLRGCKPGEIEKESVLVSNLAQLLITARGSAMPRIHVRPQQ